MAQAILCRLRQADRAERLQKSRQARMALWGKPGSCLIRLIRSSATAKRSSPSRAIHAEESMHLRIINSEGNH